MRQLTKADRPRKRRDDRCQQASETYLSHGTGSGSDNISTVEALMVALKHERSTRESHEKKLQKSKQHLSRAMEEVRDLERALQSSQAEAHMKCHKPQTPETSSLRTSCYLDALR